MTPVGMQTDDGIIAEIIATARDPLAIKSPSDPEQTSHMEVKCLDFPVCVWLSVSLRQVGERRFRLCHYGAVFRGQRRDNLPIG